MPNDRFRQGLALASLKSSMKTGTGSPLDREA